MYNKRYNKLAEVAKLLSNSGLVGVKPDLALAALLSQLIENSERQRSVYHRHYKLKMTLNNKKGYLGFFVAFSEAAQPPPLHWRAHRRPWRPHRRPWRPPRPRPRARARARRPCGLIRFELVLNVILFFKRVRALVEVLVVESVHEVRVVMEEARDGDIAIIKRVDVVDIALLHNLDVLIDLNSMISIVAELSVLGVFAGCGYS